MTELSESDQKLIQNVVEIYEEEKLEKPEKAEFFDKVVKLFTIIVKKTNKFYDDLKSENPEVVKKAKEEIVELKRISHICETSNLFAMPNKLRTTVL